MSSTIPSPFQNVVDRYFANSSKAENSKLVLTMTPLGEKQLEIKNITFLERVVAKLGLNRYFTVANANLKDVLHFCQQNHIKHEGFQRCITQYDEGRLRTWHIIDKIGNTYDSVLFPSASEIQQQKAEIEKFITIVERGAPTEDEITKGCQALNACESWWEESFPKLSDETFERLVTILYNKDGETYKAFYNISRNLDRLQENKQERQKFYNDFVGTTDMTGGF